MKLNIGGGASGIADKMVDRVHFPGVTDVVDVAVKPLPYSDNTFDEVRAEQVLEHIPTCIYWHENGEFHSRYCRVELMREIYRVLKPGGILHASVPNMQNVGWAQDPTHVDVPMPREQFAYFCGQWGGNEKGKEAEVSYGIDFAFQFMEAFDTGAILTVILRKPND